jgi:acetyl-CoA carboxylase biotin carboxyl carrier protein
MNNQATAQSSEGEEPVDVEQPTEVEDRTPGKRRARSKAPVNIALDLDELRQLVEIIDSRGFTEFEIEREGLHLRLRRELAPQIIQAVAPPVRAMESESAAPAATGATASAETESKPAAAAEPAGHIITSPIVGTFYRASSPGAEAFVNIGSSVTPDVIVCIIEAMKLMNEIQAETSGTIVNIFVENGQPVEYGQPLFEVK